MEKSCWLEKLIGLRPAVFNYLVEEYCFLLRTSDPTFNEDEFRNKLQAEVLQAAVRG